MEFGSAEGKCVFVWNTADNNRMEKKQQATHIDGTGENPQNESEQNGGGPADGVFNG